MTNNDFPYRAYAMEYGTFLGIAWTLVFTIYVFGFRTGNPNLFLLGFLGFMVLAFLPFLFAWRVKQMQYEGEKLGFLKAMSFSLNLFGFACIFTGICEYAYFCFFDNGELLTGFTNMFINPEMKTAYNQMGMAESYSQLSELLTQMQRLTAFEKTELLFNSNFMISLLMFIPVSALASIAPSPIKKRKAEGEYEK